MSAKNKPGFFTAATITAAGVLISAAVSSGSAVAQSWQPERNIEIVTGTGAGSDLDRAARAIQRISADHGLLSASAIVLNKPGANSSIAWGYIREKKGQGELLGISSPPLITNSMVGNSKLTYRDLTPLAKLYDVYMCLVVRADSPIKSMKDLLAQASMAGGRGSWALTGGAGSIPHVMLAQILSKSGIPADNVTIIHYKAAGEMMAALLGGHVDLVSSTIPNVIGALKNGQIRILAVASPQRLGGAVANAATLKEQGVDLVSTNWRGVVGAPGLSKTQIAYWDSVLSRVATHDDWKKTAAGFYWETNYMNSVQTRKFLEEQEKELGAAIGQLDIKKK